MCLHLSAYICASVCLSISVHLSSYVCVFVCISACLLCLCICLSVYVCNLSVYVCVIDYTSVCLSLTCWVRVSRADKAAFRAGIASARSESHSSLMAWAARACSLATASSAFTTWWSGRENQLSTKSLPIRSTCAASSLIIVIDSGIEPFAWLLFLCLCTCISS